MRENSPSSTAFLIAGSISCSAREPFLEMLVPSQSAQLSDRVLADSLRSGRFLLWAFRQPLFRALIRLIERVAIPGIQAHYLVRKRFIEDVARTALHEGVRQIVVLGAGFDSLCFRLHTEYETALFCEVDHPNTQQVKREVLDRRFTLQANLMFIPANLKEANLEADLCSVPVFDSNQSTLFIIEGLLMYLSETDVANLFHSLRFLGTASNRVVFTFMEPQSDGRVNFPHASRLVSWWLRLRGESFNWGIRREELPTYLTQQGIQITELVDHLELRRRYMSASIMAAVPLAEGELLCTAAIGQHA